MVSFAHGTPDGEAVSVRRSAAIDKAIADIQSEFSPDFWDAFDLRRAGRSYGYIASRQNCSKSTVHNRVMRVQKRLREYFSAFDETGKKVCPNP